MLSRPLSLLALLLVTAWAAADTPSPYEPTHVTALSGTTETLVSWLPGETPADSYRVYGLNHNEAPQLLRDTATTETPQALTATVLPGFSHYAVAGVLDGQQSGLVLAFSGLDLSCISIDFHPEPGWTIDCPIPPRLNAKVRSLP